MGVFPDSTQLFPEQTVAGMPFPFHHWTSYIINKAQRLHESASLLKQNSDCSLILHTRSLSPVSDLLIGTGKGAKAGTGSAMSKQ